MLNDNYSQDRLSWSGFVIFVVIVVALALWCCFSHENPFFGLKNTVFRWKHTVFHFLPIRLAIVSISCGVVGPMVVHTITVYLHI